jgi:arrestin-related trafficking adapter 3/6
MPASLACNGGSVTWKLMAKVRRPGVFTSNLTALREVQVVSVPADANFEMAGDIVIEKPWDDQLQYLFKVSGKVFAIGGSFNVKMVFMPMSKIRLYKLAIDIEGKRSLHIGQLTLSEICILVSRACRQLRQ